MIVGFNDTWPNATADGNSDDTTPPEPGLYEAALIVAKAFVSNAGDDWVKLEFRDVASGYDWAVLLGFKSQKQANVTKAACAKVGVNVEDVDSLEELSSALGCFEGRFFEVEVKQNGEFRNTYINGECETSEIPADTSGMQPVGATHNPDDDIPFD